MKRERAIARIAASVVAALTVSLASAAGRDEPPVFPSPPATFDMRTCTPGACSRVCHEWANNPLYPPISWCRAEDDACIYIPICITRGQKPHIEMAPVDSCEDRIDSCR